MGGLEAVVDAEGGPVRLLVAAFGGKPGRFDEDDNRDVTLTLRASTFEGLLKGTLAPERAPLVGRCRRKRQTPRRHAVRAGARPVFSAAMRRPGSASDSRARLLLVLALAASMLALTSCVAAQPPTSARRCSSATST